MKEEIQKSYDRFCTFMEKNTLGAEICCYGVALTGLTIALRRVRPFSKFKKPSDVPNRFIREKKELIGTIQRIEPNGALLMFQHKPPFTLPFTRVGSLPVKIAGIEVSGLGISWLQTIVAGREVTCIPIKKCKNFVECTVTLQQKTLDVSDDDLSIFRRCHLTLSYF
ncbi:protein C3orf33-like [Agrilus planipennis]|uniref:Protein C3orf33-like n=1 Tax=Agrilus planipennis TaxID=224129 RepID=A0A7F5RIL7_AGRPL|nr:protein C3orf33-like [Agrilus planipennis]